MGANDSGAVHSSHIQSSVRFPHCADPARGGDDRLPVGVCQGLGTCLMPVLAPRDFTPFPT